MKKPALMMLLFFCFAFLIFSAIETIDVTNISYTSATSGGYFGIRLNFKNDAPDANNLIVFTFGVNMAASFNNDEICWREFSDVDFGESRAFKKIDLASSAGNGGRMHHAFADWKGDRLV